MLDFHSHLIPGVDDGSKDIKMSVGMLDMWKEQGVDFICATPHFYADSNSPSRFLEKRNTAYASLMEALQQTPGGFSSYPEIALGAEVYYYRGLSSCEDLNSLCLQGTKLLLIEMPFGGKWTDYMIREITEIKSMGIIPVAAHIERYMKIQPSGKIDDLLNTGILIQCNAEFFLSAKTRKKAFRMISDKTIDFIGSDAHNLTSRQPDIGPAEAAIEKKLGPDALHHVRKNESLVREAFRAYKVRGGTE